MNKLKKLAEEVRLLISELLLRLALWIMPMTEEKLYFAKYLINVYSKKIKEFEAKS